ncbi:hypothetical protein MMC07_002573 [Pseudocyphellaria aurata]|nr:hypothetical protein [Pseudocyphellaria aurata]
MSNQLLLRLYTPDKYTPDKPKKPKISKRAFNCMTDSCTRIAHSLRLLQYENERDRKVNHPQISQKKAPSELYKEEQRQTSTAKVKPCSYPSGKPSHAPESRSKPTPRPLRHPRSLLNMIHPVIIHEDYLLGCGVDLRDEDAVELCLRRAGLWREPRCELTRKAAVNR